MDMQNFTLAAAMDWKNYLMAAAIVTVCILMIIIILLQKGRGGGLAAAFGGGGSGSAFGAKTGDVFTWITVSFAALYLVLNVAGNFVFRPAVADTPSTVTPVVITPGVDTDTPAGGTDPAARGSGGVKIRLGDILEFDTTPVDEATSEDQDSADPTDAGADVQAPAEDPAAASPDENNPDENNEDAPAKQPGDEA